MVPDAIRSALCCPACQSVELNESDVKFRCQSCGWQSTLVDGDTPSFAPIVYDGARTKTRRTTKPNSLLNNRLRWLKAVHKRLVPWRHWVFRNPAAQQAAIDIFRRQEMDVVQRILGEALTSRQQLLLELGVGFQDHVTFYKQLAEFAICSDIYRDPAAVEVYKDVPWIFYCLINVEQLPLRESSVDVLLTSHVVEHFPDRVNNLRALHRVLKPGAIACHVVPTATGILLGHVVATAVNVMTLVPRIGNGVHGEYDSVWQELRETTVRAWRTLFESCGFQVLREEPGTLGFAAFHSFVTHLLADTLKLRNFGSRVFVLRTVK